jgi:hypothetical protein
MNKNTQNKIHKYSLSEKNILKANKLAQIDESEMKYLVTQQKFNTNQKLFDFISDKSKIVLKSCFDYKGSKQFLEGKSEAMKKIELNESILDENQNKNKNKKVRVHNSLKLNFLISDHLLNKMEDNKKYISCYSINNNDKKSKIQNEEFINNNIYLQDNYINKKNIKTSEKKKQKKHLDTDYNNVPNNLDLSIDSKVSLNSQLFNNNKEYKNSTKLISKDDILFYEELLSELKSNKNKK